MLLKEKDLVNIFHIIFVAPLFYTIGNDTFPSKYKKQLIKLAIGIAIYHAYGFAKRNNICNL